MERLKHEWVKPQSHYYIVALLLAAFLIGYGIHAATRYPDIIGSWQCQNGTAGLVKATFMPDGHVAVERLSATRAPLDNGDWAWMDRNHIMLHIQRFSASNEVLSVEVQDNQLVLGANDHTTAMQRVD